MEKAEELDNVTARTNITQKHVCTYIKIHTLGSISALQNNCPVILPALTFPQFSANLNL